MSSPAVAAARLSSTAVPTERQMSTAVAAARQMMSTAVPTARRSAAVDHSEARSLLRAAMCSSHCHFQRLGRHIHHDATDIQQLPFPIAFFISLLMLEASFCKEGTFNYICII